MHRDIFENWFHKKIVPKLSFLKEKALPQKAVLLLDSVPSLPRTLSLDDGLIVLKLLPPDFTIIIQPMG
jgi:hypothetical protein